MSRSPRGPRRRPHPAAGDRARPAPPRSPRWLARAEWIVALVASALALALHLRLWSAAGPLWRDEVNTLVVATQPSLGQLWARLVGESFPLLPFVLLRGFCGAWPGGSEAGLRAFGLLVGLLVLASLWLVRRLLGPSPPLWSLALFASSPVAIRWGDSVRGYGLAMLTSLLAFGLLFRALRRPGPRSLGLAALAAVASVQALYQNGVLLLATGIAAAVVCWRGRRRAAALQVLGVGGVAALSLLPYVGVIARSREASVVSMEAISLRSLLEVAWRALGGDPGLQGPVRAMPLVWAALVLAAVAAGVARLVLSPRRTSRRRRELALYSLLTLLLAIPLHFALLLRVGFRTQPWYYLALMGVAVCCVEALLDDRSPGPRLIRLCCVGGLVGLLAPGAYDYLGLRQTNMDRVAAALRSAGGDDLVVVTPWYYGVSFNHYYDGPAPWSTLPPLADHSLHRPDLVKAQLAAQDPVGPLFERVRATLASGHRVFLVGHLGGRVSERPPKLPPAPGVATGWWQGTYGANWSSQLQFDLQHHARSARALDVAAGPRVIPYEVVGAWVVEGWR